MESVELDTEQYTVQCTGKIDPNFDRSEVVASVASLFKMDQAKAAKLVASRHQIKKGLSKHKALAYQNKLASVGLVVELVAPFALALEPIDGEEPTDSVEVSANSGEPKEKATPLWTCPKCGLEQKKAEQCEGCGVYQHKVAARQQVDQAVDSNPEPRHHSLKPRDEDETVNSNDDDVAISEDADTSLLIPLAAGAGAALVGALLWRFIALSFGIELGFLAWAIGGAIGFAVVMAGGKGDQVAVMCGALALVAIIGGKYLMVDGLKSQLQDSLTSIGISDEDYRAMFDDEKASALAYSDIAHNEDAVKQYIVDNDYADTYEVDDVTAEDLDYFYENAAPRLEQMASSAVDFEEWKSMNSFFGDVSSTELLMEDLGAIDLLFLFLGVGTAYRLGRGE